MPNCENSQGLCNQLKTEMDSVGRDLGQLMQQILEALELRNGAATERLLGRLDDGPGRVQSVFHDFYPNPVE